MTEKGRKEQAKGGDEADAASRRARRWRPVRTT